MRTWNTNRKSVLFLISGTVAAIVMLVACSSPSQPSLVAPASDPGSKSSESESENDSDFEIIVYQGADVLGGQAVRFSGVLARGKPVVLNMWAGLCPACRTEMPMLQEVYNRYGGRLLVIGVDIGPIVGMGSEEDARALLDELEITFPVGTTPDTTVIRDYKVIGMPTTYTITPNGEIIEQWTGVLTEDQLHGRIEALLEATEG
jgi:thiol-disulfide isomerase/thioredoxin